MKVFNSPRIRKLEQGQAFAEYMVLYPIMIGVMIAASAVGFALVNGYQRVVDAFDTPVVCQINDETFALTETEMGNHKIVPTSIVTDGNVTTVSYTVTSGPSPSISHWTLGVSEEVANNLISANEQYEIGFDPTTGVYGIKFDTGYEVEGDSGKPAPADDPVDDPVEEEEDDGKDRGRPENPGRGGGRNPKVTIHIYQADDGSNDEASRTIVMMFEGEYDYGYAPVTIKAGQDVYEETIIAPIAPSASESAADEDETGTSGCA